MNHHSFAFGLAAALGLAAPGAAQERPADLTELPPVPTDYTPPKTAWGDWDFSATYQIEFYNAGRILFQRREASDHKAGHAGACADFRGT